MFKRLPIQIFILLLAGFLVGLINNTVNPNGIPWFQDYSIIEDDEEIIIPFSWDPDQDTVFTLLTSKTAFQAFSDGSAIFIDARLLEEYEEGHISGAINIDFDGDAELYDFQVSELAMLAQSDSYLITYCAGTECDASLMLARNLYLDHGYTNIGIFFGGWELWTEKEFPIEKGIE